VGCESDLIHQRSQLGRPPQAHRERASGDARLKGESPVPFCHRRQTVPVNGGCARAALLARHAGSSGTATTLSPVQRKGYGTMPSERVVKTRACPTPGEATWNTATWSCGGLQRGAHKTQPTTARSLTCSNLLVEKRRPGGWGGYAEGRGA
jgi:hypothetical protein